MADVLQYIEEHYPEQIKLNELAKIAGVSEQHLCRLFKKNFQLRPMEYLAQVRVQHAKVKIDEEKALIGLLIYILYKQGADIKLLLALGYLLL